MLTKDREKAYKIKKVLSSLVDISDQGGIGGILSTTMSNPPPGYFRVVNLYVNEAGKLIVEYDDQPVT